VSAVTHAYDLALWLLQRVADFPRAHRFTLGERIEDATLEALELLVEASYTRDKAALLTAANRRLDRLRYLVRMAKDLRMMTTKQYEFAVRGMLEIGSEIGGWLRSEGDRSA